MPRTFLVLALALASLAAAATVRLCWPFRAKSAAPTPVAVASASASGLRMQALLERLYLAEDRSTNAYLEVDLIADSDSGVRRAPVPVNAVLILDRSGSMSGVKIERAREAARALVQALGPADRLAVVEFSSGASVLLHSTPLTPDARSRALAAIEDILKK